MLGVLLHFKAYVFLNQEILEGLGTAVGHLPERCRGHYCCPRPWPACLAEASPPLALQTNMSSATPSDPRRLPIPVLSKVNVLPVD